MSKRLEWLKKELPALRRKLRAGKKEEVARALEERGMCLVGAQTEAGCRPLFAPTEGRLGRREVLYLNTGWPERKVGGEFYLTKEKRYLDMFRWRHPGIAAYLTEMEKLWPRMRPRVLSSCTDKLAVMPLNRATDNLYYVGVATYLLDESVNEETDEDEYDDEDREGEDDE